MMKKITLKKVGLLLAFIFIGSMTFAQVDVSVGTFSALNTSFSGQTNIFKTPTASISNGNFTNTGAWANIFDTSNSAPRLAQQSIPINEGYKFEVSSNYNPILVTQVRYTFENGASNRGNPGNSQWNVQGSNDDSTWTTISGIKQMYSGTSGTEVELTVTAGIAYRYYRFVLAAAWTSTYQYNALVKLDFTVGGTAIEDVAAGDFSAFNTSSSSQANIFNTPTASIDNANFSNNGGAWANILISGSANAPRLVQNALAPVGEGYKFEVAAGYNPIVVSEVRYKFDNGASNQGAPDGSIWIVQGSNDDSSWDDLSTPLQFFTSNTGSSEYTIPLTLSTKAYRYFRFVLSTAWTPAGAYTALRQLDFTVAALWDGSSSSTWSTTSNWNTNVEPAATHDVIIPAGLTNYPTATSALTVRSLTLESGATFMSNSTVTGDVTYKRTLGTFDKWYLVSSPVDGEIMTDMRANNNFADNGGEISFAPYDNSQAASTDRWSYFANTATTPLTKGKGYSTKLSAVGIISFTGSYNSGATSIALTQGGVNGNNFNLIGNPSTAYINSGTFLTTNTAELEQEEIYVWNQSNGTYETKVSGTPFIVAPGQGFFVEAKTTNNVTFTEAIQSHETTDTFQKTEKSEIKLSISDNTVSRNASIYYIEGKTTGFDNGYDGKLFGGVPQPFALYTHLVTNSEGKNYQIQSLPNTDLGSMVIPVGLNAVDGKEITFSAEVLNLPTEMKVYLEDRLTNTFTRLDEANTTYKVTLTEALNGIGRFYIHTAQKALNIDTALALENISIYKTDSDTLRIVGLQNGNTTIKLFNILGKKVINTSFKSKGVKDISLSKLASGIYIVQLENEAGKLNKKIILE